MLTTIIGWVHCQAQTDKVGLGSAQRHFAQYERGRDQLFEEAFNAYQRHLHQFPSDIIARAERCRLAWLFAYDEESHTLVEAAVEHAKGCRKRVYERYPDDPEAIILLMEETFGEDAASSYRSYSNGGFPGWSTDQAERFEATIIANSYWVDDETIAALNAKKFQNDPSQILHGLEAAEYYFANGDTERATGLLNAIPADSAQDWHRLRQFRLLLKYEQAELALATYQDIRQAKQAQPNDDDLARLYILLDQREQAVEKARQYLTVSHDPRKIGKEYFELALRHAGPDLMHDVYELFRTQDAFNDPLSHHRWRLVQATGFSFSLGDLYLILNWLLVLALCIALPLLLLIPVHYRSLLKQRRGWQPNDFVGHWNLRHAWFFSALFLICDTLVTFIWSYPEIESALFDTADVAMTNINEGMIRGLLFTDLVMLITLPFAVFPSWRLLVKSRWSLAGTGFLIFALYVALRLLALPFHGANESTGLIAKFTPDGIQSLVLILHNTYGLGLTILSVGILTPVIEELLFRGILLSALSKHVHFFWANLMQATIFALIHIDTYLIVFYVTFGLVNGYLVKSSRSLLPPILLHMLNNIVACVAIGYLTTR